MSKKMYLVQGVVTNVEFSSTGSMTMNNFKQNVIFAIVLIVQMFTLNTAMAHGGAHAVNGGIVEVLGDVALELVVLDDAVELYMVDDGVEISVEGMSATLKIENGDEKTELPLAFAGRNKFAVQGQSIAIGAKVTAVVVRQDGYSKIIIDFTIE